MRRKDLWRWRLLHDGLALLVLFQVLKLAPLVDASALWQLILLVLAVVCLLE